MFAPIHPQKIGFQFISRVSDGVELKFFDAELENHFFMGLDWKCQKKPSDEPLKKKTFFEPAHQSTRTRAFTYGGFVFLAIRTCI